eukprot:31157-Pelagococcus_subviridis.AAC.21
MTVSATPPPIAQESIVPERGHEALEHVRERARAQQDRRRVVHARRVPARDERRERDAVVRALRGGRAREAAVADLAGVLAHRTLVVVRVDVFVRRRGPGPPLRRDRARGSVLRPLPRRARRRRGEAQGVLHRPGPVQGALDGRHGPGADVQGRDVARGEGQRRVRGHGLPPVEDDGWTGGSGV